MEPGHAHPSHQKSRGKTGRIKAGPCSSVDWEPPEEMDVLFLLLRLEHKKDPSCAENWPELLEPTAD